MTLLSLPPQKIPGRILHGDKKYVNLKFHENKIIHGK
jgi:hypothetical protein